LKQIRRHITYANVMSSLAVFLILGGATAFAAIKKVGANEIKANSIKTGKIVKEAVTAGKIKNLAVTEGKLADGAVTTNKLADNAVTTPKIAKDAVTAEKLAKNAVTTEKIVNDAVTGDKVKESTLGQVPSAANSAALGGIAASGYAQRMFARVNYTTATPSLTAASPGISASGESLLGFPLLTFPRSMDNCAIVGTANSGAGTQIFRRSTGSTGATVQFAIKDDAGAAIRSSFEIIAVC
jgi:hypothetical protein